MPPKKPPATRELPRGYGYIQTVAAPDGLHKVQARWRDGTANRSKTFTAATEQACRDAAIDHLMRVHRDRRDGRYVLPSPMTVADLVDDHLERNRRNYNGSTYGTYREWADRWITPHLGGVRLVALTTYRVQSWVDHLADAHAPRTVRNVKRLLGAALEHAVDMEIIDRNPARRVKVPIAKRTEHATWSAAEVATVYRYVADDPFIDAYYRVALATGMRPGELRALQWRDVDLAIRTIHVRRTATKDDHRRPMVGDQTKTGNARKVAIPASAVAALERWRDAQGVTRRSAATWDIAGYVLTSRADGGIMPDNGVRSFHNRVIRETGVTKITLHATRHSCASLMAEHGVPLVVVANLLGHRGIAVTADTYTHPTVGMQVAAVDALDAVIGATTLVSAES